jgi:hypothetical protein
MVCAVCLFIFSTLLFSQDDKKQKPQKEPVKFKKLKAGKSDLKQIKQITPIGTEMKKQGVQQRIK